MTVHQIEISVIFHNFPIDCFSLPCLISGGYSTRSKGCLRLAKLFTM